MTIVTDINTTILTVITIIMESIGSIAAMYECTSFLSSNSIGDCGQFLLDSDPLTERILQNDGT
ncbi:hypothetical protein MMC21_000324 [Puttea exsequens]|nr:hypothetical protein [Puttea exsequens]